MPRGRTAEGWGETPLCGPVGLAERARLRGAAPGAPGSSRARLAEAWARVPASRGIPIEVGDRLHRGRSCPACSTTFNRRASAGRRADALAGGAGLRSAFDLARARRLRRPARRADLRDLQRPVHERRPRRATSSPAEGSDVSFAGSYPEDFLVRPRPDRLPAWHLVGGKDPLDASELTGARARRRLPRPAPRLDPPRRPEVPEGQAPRRRRRLGLRPAGRGRRDRRRGGRGLADRRLQLHGPRPRLRQRDPRPADRASIRGSTG